MDGSKEQPDVDSVGITDVDIFYFILNTGFIKAKRMINLMSLLELKNQVSDYLMNNSISEEDAKFIYNKLGYDFDFDEFYQGINVETEHRDIIGNNLEKTAKIAAAHLQEVPNYYTLLKKYVEKSKNTNEDGVGLVSPTGQINGAPKPKDVKKMRKKLDSENVND